MSEQRTAEFDKSIWYQVGNQNNLQATEDHRNSRVLKICIYILVIVNEFW